MLIFKVFDITSTDAIYQKTIEFDPECAKAIPQIKELFQLQKDKQCYVYPTGNCEIEFLLKPKQRGRTSIPDEVIKFIIEQFVNHFKLPIQIQRLVYKEFGLEINSNQLSDILSQKKYAHVPGLDDLRKKAEQMMPKKQGRKVKITDSMKQEWEQHRKQGMSGNAIAKLYDVSSVSVNTYFRDQHGYARKPKPVITNE